MDLETITDMYFDSVLLDYPTLQGLGTVGQSLKAQTGCISREKH